MPALNFKNQFTDAVLIGTKRQTIRATRKNPIKAGDTLHLFTGMRSKKCRRLRVTKCTRAIPISIYTSGCSGIVKICGLEIAAEAVERMAKADGFPNVGEFLDFFADNHGPNFEGQLIEWTP